ENLLITASTPPNELNINTENMLINNICILNFLLYKITIQKNKDTNTTPNIDIVIRHEIDERNTMPFNFFFSE
ncbi:hypothetical protein CGI91_24160, partial [Vibrio parahaemolyticus]